MYRDDLGRIYGKRLDLEDKTLMKDFELDPALSLKQSANENDLNYLLMHI